MKSVATFRKGGFAKWFAIYIERSANSVYQDSGKSDGGVRSTAADRVMSNVRTNVGCSDVRTNVGCIDGQSRTGRPVPRLRYQRTLFLVPQGKSLAVSLQGRTQKKNRNCI
jgi:hypothetical protein